MRGSLILRLVDVVLLLLLSLMATSTIRTADVEPPVSRRVEVGSTRLHPLQVAITPDGHFLPIDGPSSAETMTLHDLYGAIERLQMGRVVEFIADRRAPARLLIEANRVVQAAGREAVFLVELDPNKP